MQHYLFVMGSITHAIRGRDVLRAKGYRVFMERTPSQIDRLGCSYSLHLTGDADAARQILEQAGIRPKQVLERNAPNGKRE